MKFYFYSLIIYSVLITSVLGNPNIRLGPYLQPTDSMETSITIVWKTTSEVAGKLYYGINDSKEFSMETPPSLEHFVKLTGLQPGTVYKYSVEAGGEYSDVYEFRTSPPDGKFKLLVTSDWHMRYDTKYYVNIQKMMPDMLAFDPDVVLNTGDLGYDGKQSEFDAFLEAGRLLFATAVLAPVQGNHDDSYENKGVFFKDQFVLPENGPEDCLETTYSFNYGGVHFVAMQMNYDVDNGWLKKDLQNARELNPNFIFAASHLPTYGKRSKKGKERPFYDAYDVDIEFAGHNHRLYRSFPIIQNTYDAYHQLGLIYSPVKDYYNDTVRGTIYHGIRATSYGKYGSTDGSSALYIAAHGLTGYSGDEKKKKECVGYTEVTIDGEKAVFNSYKYDELLENRKLEDSYTINKNDQLEFDTTKITPHNIIISQDNSYRTIIKWESELPCRGQIEFGMDQGNYPYLNMRDGQNQQFKTSHELVLQGLNPGTTYYFRVKCWREGKYVLSDEYSFTTSSEIQIDDLVAEYDFGGIETATDMVRASPGMYDKRIRQGWDQNNVQGVANSCVVNNKKKSFIATWKTELPNGKYDIELTISNGGYYWGEQCFDIENGQVLFQADKPETDTRDTTWVWPGTVLIEDGFLDIKMGCGSGKKYTFLSKLKIYVSGNRSGDVVPPLADAGPDQTVEKGTAVNFDASGSTDNVGITSYAWDFDASDGIQKDASGKNVSNFFNTPGVYTVTLTVTDASGNGPSMDTMIVNVTGDLKVPQTFSFPGARTFAAPENITLFANESAILYYTVDGSLPVVGNANTFSNVKSVDIPITNDTTVNYFAVDGDGNEEAVKTEIYTIAAPNTVYYVDAAAAAAAGGNGSESAPFNTIQTALGTAQAGDTIIVKDGIYDESLTTRTGGTSDAPVYIKAENKHGAVLQRRGTVWEVKHPYIIIDGFLFDGKFSTSNGLLVLRDTAHDFILKNSILRNNQRHILRIASPENVVIDNCEIYNAFRFDNVDGKLKRSEYDAHGISTEGVKNMIIRNTSIHDVSGDCFQPEYGAWDNIVLKNVQLWNRPVLEETAHALSLAVGDSLLEQLKGKYPGENAIDTKQHEYHGRGKLYLENVTAYGWRSDFISNASAFNLKHNVEVSVDGVTAYDNEICFRLRGPGSHGGAWVTLKNVVMYDSDTGVRYEDDIENLLIYHTTWGNNVETFFESAGGYGNGFEVNNCLFLSSNTPEEALQGNNIAVDETDFVNVIANDYHLNKMSDVIDSGESIPEVQSDLDGVLRPQGEKFDCGAYEYSDDYEEISFTGVYQAEFDHQDDENSGKEIILNLVQTRNKLTGFMEIRDTINCLYDNNSAGIFQVKLSGEVIDSIAFFETEADSVIDPDNEGCSHAQYQYKKNYRAILIQNRTILQVSELNADHLSVDFIKINDSACVSLEEKPVILTDLQLDMTSPVRISFNPTYVTYDIAFPCYTTPVDIYVVFFAPDGHFESINIDGKSALDLNALSINSITPIEFKTSFSNHPAGLYTVYWAVVPTNNGNLLAVDWTKPSILGSLFYQMQ